MDAPEAPQTTTKTPSVTKAVDAVARDLSGVKGSYERIVIQQAGPTMYVYRAHPVGGGDYVGGTVTLD